MSHLQGPIASLPWYDHPEVADALDAFWAFIHAGLVAKGVTAPARLERQVPVRRQWESPQLLLSQACGYDLVVTSPDKLRLVATPVFSLPDCPAGDYRSLVVVHRESSVAELLELRGARCAINEPESHSGMGCLRAMLLNQGLFFSEIRATGSHRRSLVEVGRGRADVAAVDEVTFRLLQHHRPQLVEQVRILALTPTAPAPPFVTSVHTPAGVVELLRELLLGASWEASLQWALKALLWKAVCYRPLEHYLVLSRMEAEARERLDEESLWPRAKEVG